MKKGLLILAAACSIAISYAQTVTFEWGEEARKTGDYYATNMEFLMTKDGNYYFMSEEKKNFSVPKYTVYKFGADMNLVSSTLIDMPEKIGNVPVFMGGQPDLRGAVNFNGKGYLLFDSYSGKDDRFITTLTEVVDNGKNVTFKHIQVIEGKEYSSGKSYFTMSPDASQLLVAHCSPYSGTKDAYKIYFKVFDSNMNELWKKEVEPEGYYYNPFITYTDVMNIDNNGVITFAYLERDKQYNKKLASSNNFRKYFKTNILVLSNEGETIKTLYPESGKYTIDNLAVTTHNGKLLCVGNIFDPNGEIDNDYGVISFTIDNTGKQDNTTIVPLTDFSEIEKGKANDDYDFDDISIFKSDNGILITYESSEVDRTGDGQYIYKDKGVIVQQFNPDGQLLWSNYINKFQKTASDGGNLSSHFSIVDENLNAIIVYTAFGKNKDAEKEERDENNTTYQVTFDKGQMNKKALFSAKEQGIYIAPETFTYIGNNEWVIIAEQKPKLRLGKVTLK